MNIGKPAQAFVNIRTGRNGIQRAYLRFSSSDISIDASAGQTDGGLDDKSGKLRLLILRTSPWFDLCKGRSPKLTDIDRGSRITCLLPYENPQGKTSVCAHTSIFHSEATDVLYKKVVIDAEFTNKDKPQLTRSLKLVKIVSVSQPVAVNVRDFFRGQR